MLPDYQIIPEAFVGHCHKTTHTMSNGKCVFQTTAVDYSPAKGQTLHSGARVLFFSFYNVNEINFTRSIGIPRINNRTKLWQASVGVGALTF